MVIELVERLARGGLDRGFGLAALVAVALAVAGVAFGLAHDDVVTALGALLFLPVAAILLGIGLRTGGRGRRRSGPGGTA
jgi:hypothetical protein